MSAAVRQHDEHARGHAAPPDVPAVWVTADLRPVARNIATAKTLRRSRALVHARAPPDSAHLTFLGRRSTTTRIFDARRWKTEPQDRRVPQSPRRHRGHRRRGARRRSEGLRARLRSLRHHRDAPFARGRADLRGARRTCWRAACPTRRRCLPNSGGRSRRTSTARYDNSARTWALGGPRSTTSRRPWRGWWKPAPPLAVEIGRKGYHEKVFADGPFAVRRAAGGLAAACVEPGFRIGALLENLLFRRFAAGG